MAMATSAEAESGHVDLQALLNDSKDWVDSDDDADPDPDFDEMNRMLEMPTTSADEAGRRRLEEATRPPKIPEPKIVVADSEESEAEAEDEMDEDEKESKTRREKRRIRALPPGLNIFSGPFLANFSASELRLEEHFEYDKRELLRRCGVSEADIAEMLSDVEVFLAHLAPTFQSALVENQQDFARICDYLFYYCSSCADECLHEMAKRALFDLLRNYSYLWKLSLEHILTALANLGAETKLLTNEATIKDIISNRLNLLNRASKRSGKGPYKFQLPKVKGTLVRLTPREETDASELDRMGCIKMFVRLVADLLSGWDARKTVFRPTSDDWTAQLALLYVFQYVSVDRALVGDSLFAASVRQLFHALFQTFTAFQWSGEARLRSDKAVDKESLSDGENNACSDVSEMLADSLGSSETLREAVCTWEREDVPPQKHMAAIDHHHNMIRRLQLLPLTCRGNQVKKNVAFLQLQQIINTDCIQSFTRTDVIDFYTFVLDSVDNRAKFKAYIKDENYVMLNLIRLVDMIVGCEASDCLGDKRSAITAVIAQLKDCEKRIPTDALKTDGSRVKELINAVTAKWKLMQDRSRRARMLAKIQREDAQALKT